MSSPLRMPPDQMRDLGYRTVDAIVDHLATLRERPVGRAPDPELLERLFDRRLPETPSDPVEVMQQSVRDVLATIVHTDHPRFMAYVPGPSNYVGAVADFIAAGVNVFAGHGLVGAGPATVERITVDWLRRLCGFPESAGGLFVSGGTMANLVAVHAARVHSTAAERGAVYVGEQTHSSIRKGLRFLGLPDSRVRLVPSDDRHRMSVPALRRALAKDRAAGQPALCVIATAGTTSTGSVDPLDELVGVCAEHDAWLHVDGAYGAAAVLSDRSQDLLTGLERADSIALDPHKWWFQPYEAGCVLVRDGASLTAAFSMEAEYLRETRAPSVPLNYYDLGPQLTRSFRALKIWMSVRTFGLDAFRQAVEHGIALVEYAEQLVSASPCWEVVTPAQLAVLTFRPRLPELRPDTVAGITRRVAAATLRDGHTLVTTTELADTPVLRLCTTHPEATHEDIETTLALLEHLLATETARASGESTDPRRAAEP